MAARQRAAGNLSDLDTDRIAALEEEAWLEADRASLEVVEARERLWVLLGVGASEAGSLGLACGLGDPKGDTEVPSEDAVEIDFADPDLPGSETW